ncbi:UNVERIFIED_CONTAM: hypothetical protein FKN15_052217 [Acipenser sinensis]
MPYGGKKKSWSWASYLEQEKAIPAPSKLFKESKNTNDTVFPSASSVLCGISRVKEDEFNWQSYLKLCKAQAAPKSLFENRNTTVTPSGFRIGMKFEAIDRKNPSFICVATVTDMVDSRFLVHFDNWDESYDYCNKQPLLYPWVSFSLHKMIQIAHWSKNYLIKGGYCVLPPKCILIFRCHTLLSSAAAIHFDGWCDEYDYWVDADSPDIHPAGWCAKTGHTLQPPISPQDMFEASEQGGCPTPGCKGVGHIKGARYSGHHSP